MSRRDLGIALVAHDRMKPGLADWVAENRARLERHRLYATGTTGGHIVARNPDLAITRLASGPLGGDLQIGAKVVEGEIDMLVFLVDPMTPQPHDVDVKALLRIATLYDTPMACNRSTADTLIAAPWMEAPECLVRTEDPFVAQKPHRGTGEPG